jgi:hypothetical protein
VPIQPGVLGYIPPGWTHRSVNTGDEPFVFISVYPALSGQNYEPVRRSGLGARVRRDMQSAPTAAESSSAEPNHLLPLQRRSGQEAWAGSMHALQRVHRMRNERARAFQRVIRGGLKGHPR